MKNPILVALFILLFLTGVQAGANPADSANREVDMVFVERGSFNMGDEVGDLWQENRPVHKVTLTYDFYIDKYEVTFDEYDAFCESTGKSKPGDEGWGREKRPVINVSWNDAMEYCNWLSEKEKLPKAYDENGNLIDRDGVVVTDPSKVVGYRLPTEAEWEYAARGGKESKGFWYSGSNNADEVAWYSHNSGDELLEGSLSDESGLKAITENNCRSHEVGTKAPNEIGLYDMSGNVWELCSDWFYDYTDSGQTNPYNDSGSFKVFHGGSWFDHVSRLRVAGRSGNGRTFKYYYLGFRVCRTAF